MQTQPVHFVSDAGQVRVTHDWPAQIEATDAFLAQVDPQYSTSGRETLDFAVANGCASYLLVERRPTCRTSIWRKVVGIYRSDG